MSAITVRVYSRLIKSLGTASVFLDAGNVAEVMNKLGEIYGARFKDEVYDENNKIKRSYILTLNGRVVDRDGLQSVKMSAGDVLHIFPPVMAGG